MERAVRDARAAGVRPVEGREVEVGLVGYP